MWLGVAGTAGETSLGTVRGEVSLRREGRSLISLVVDGVSGPMSGAFLPIPAWVWLASYSNRFMSLDAEGKD